MSNCKHRYGISAHRPSSRSEGLLEGRFPIVKFPWRLHCIEEYQADVSFTDVTKICGKAYKEGARLMSENALFGCPSFAFCMVIALRMPVVYQTRNEPTY